MIKVKCGSCGHSLGIPEKFAGKRVLCPKCKASINVPNSAQSSIAQQHNLIKFRCPKCSQKIGLPIEYAGKQVRCAKCKNPMRVPNVSPAAKPVPTPQEQIPPEDDFNPLADLSDSSDLLQPKPTKSPTETPLRLQPLNNPTRQGNFDNMATDLSPGGTTFGASSSSSGSSGFEIDNNSVALLAGIIFVILGGMLWGLVAKYTNMELGILAWFMGVLAGLGVYWFTSSRGVLLGIALAFIAFFGILCGKYFVAKWHFMPLFKAEFKDRSLSEFIDANDIRMTSEQIREIIADPSQMFAMATMQLAEDGEINEGDAEYYIMDKLNNAFGATVPENPEDPIDKQQRLLRQKDLESKVYKCLAEWSDEKKEQVIRAQYPRIMKKYADAFTDSPLINVVGFVAAYIASFSLFDLIWFPCAMVTAYKFGTGEHS